MSKIIAIPIEILVRELDSKLLLSAFLLKNDIDVLIGPRGSIFTELKYLKNASLLYKSISVDIKEVMKNIVNNGGRNFILDEEANNFSKNQDNIIKSIFPKEMLGYIDLFFLSGSKIRDLVIKNRPEIPLQKLVVSGNPRFDFFKKPYVNFYKQDKDEIISKYKKTILFNLNFSMGNPYRGWDNQIKYLTNHPDFNKSFIDDIKKKMKWQKNNMRIYIDSIIKVAKTFKEYSIIVRPHPSENDKYYESFFSDYGNIFINKSGNVIPWILASTISIHYDCTTGIETILNGKRSISFTCNKDKSLVNWLSPFVCDEVSTTNQLILKLEQHLLSKNNWSPSKYKLSILNSYINNYSKDSLNIISKKIADEMPHVKTLYFNRFYRFFQRMKRYLGKIRRVYFIKDEYTHHFKSLKKKEIILKFNILKNILDLQFDLEIIPHGIDTYLLKKKK